MGKFIKTVSQFGENKFFIYQKHDAAGKIVSLLSFVPKMGANIIDLLLVGESLIDGHKNSKDLATRQSYKSEILAPFPNRLASGKFTFDQQTFCFPINDLDHGHALHGFIANEPFEVMEELLSESLSVTLKCSYNKNYEYFPFKFELMVKYTITGENFSISIDVKNIGTERLPFGLGWHPYFIIGKNEKATIESCFLDKILMDENMIPSGESGEVHFVSKKLKDLSLDNTYKIKGAPGEALIALRRILKIGRVLQLSFTNKSNETAFEYLQLFHPKDSSSIAIEPMTCNVDALNNGEGLLLLESGGKSTYEFSVDAKLIQT